MDGWMDGWMDDGWMDKWMDMDREKPSRNQMEIDKT